MKNLILFIAICILTGTFFSSCKTNTSITERRYNRGYYVTHIKDNPDLIASNNQKEIVLADRSGKALKNAVIDNGNKTDETYNEKFEADNIVVSTGNEKKYDKGIDPNIKKAGQDKLKIFELPDIQANKTFLNSNKDHLQDPDGLSLFWIVILVVLILWALGFIGGLGGLIHILLVVALILLILWLLRVL